MITVFFSMIKEKNLEELIRYFQVQSITGIVIFGMSRQDKVLHNLVESGNFKVVLVDAPVVNDQTSCVWIDQSQAQSDVIEHTILMSRYHCKSLLYIAGREQGYVTQYRLKGAHQIAEQMKLQLRVEKGDFSELRAREITMRHGKEFDIIACASDLMAIGAMRALTEMDIFHPVCGFDGITLMGYAGMQMNTVKQDFAAVASAAVGELNRLLEGGKGQQIILPHTLERLQYLDIIC